MESYYYVYETQNLTNGKKYIGQHCTHDLNDGYFGSQLDLIKDIKYKGHQYKVTILKWCKNIWHLGYEEHEEIKNKGAVKDPFYYNKNNPLHINYIFEYGNTEEQKVKISKTLTGKKLSKFHRKQIIKSLGRKHSEVTKKKQRESRLKYLKDHPVVITQTQIEKIRKSNTGLKRSPEAIKHYCEAQQKIHRGTVKTCEFCGKTVNLLNYRRWHGKRCRSKNL